MVTSSDRQIRLILYRLKRTFGRSVTLRSRTVTYTVSTGVGVPTNTDVTIKRCIVLPTSALRNFAYDLSFIAANKNFTYGGFFDLNTQMFIIDVKDLPSGSEITMDHMLIYNSRPYDIARLARTEGDLGYLIQGKELSNEPDVT